jgi:hypothetical protein
VLLVLITMGLLAFALWQLAAAAFGQAYGVRRRVGAAAKAVACGALATVTAGFVDGRGEPSGDTGARTLTGRVLALPGGALLVGLGGVVVLGVAAAMVYTGLRRTFMHDLEVRDLAPGVRRGIAVLGAVGHLARALALGLVGVGIVTAAANGNARSSGGLDAALRDLGSTDVGSWLLVAVAFGFAAFALFCVADAAIRRA